MIEHITIEDCVIATKLTDKINEIVDGMNTPLGDLKTKDIDLVDKEANIASLSAELNDKVYEIQTKTRLIGELEGEIINLKKRVGELGGYSVL